MVEDQFEVRPPRPDGWTMLYNESARALIGEHSKVISCYLSLCIRSNGERSCFLSRSQIAEDMGGVSVDTVDRAIKRLEAIGVLTVERQESPGRGMANVYVLTKPEKGRIAAAALSGEKGRIAAAALSGEKGRIAAAAPINNKRETTSNSPLPPNGDGGERMDGGKDSPGERTMRQRMDRDGASTPNHSTMAHRSSGANEQTSRVSNQVKRESDHPLWQIADGYWQELFDFIYSAWPKQSQRELAMTAFRTEVVPVCQEDRQFPEKLWRIVQWQMESWQREGREQRFIPALHRWLERRSWQDAP